jgi:hypothetical protein
LVAALPASEGGHEASSQFLSLCSVLKTQALHSKIKNLVLNSLKKKIGAEERREIKNIYYAACFTNPSSDPTKINSTRTDTLSSSFPCPPMAGGYHSPEGASENSRVRGHV